MAMGYEVKQIPTLIARSKPQLGEGGISIHAVKQYRKVIAQKRGVPNKETVLVAWYIARAMELEYGPSASLKQTPRAHLP
jgi:hypothetical protein